MSSSRREALVVDAEPGHADAGWREAAGLIWRYRKRVAGAVLLMVVSRGASLALPLAPKVLIDDVILGGRHDLFLPIVAALATAGVIAAASSFALTRLIGMSAQKTIVDTRRLLHRTACRLPTSYFDSVQGGALVSRVMTDPEALQHIVGASALRLSGNVCTAAVALGALALLSWRLTLSLVLILFVFGFVMRTGFKYFRPIYRRQRTLTADATALLAEQLGGIRTIKAYGLEKQMERAFVRRLHDLLRNASTSITGAAVLSGLPSLCVAAIGIAIVFVGGRGVLAGQLTVGGLAMFLTFAGLIVNPVMGIVTSSTKFGEAFASLDRVRELVTTETEPVHGFGRAQMASVQGRVSCQELTFRYPSGTRAVSSVTLSLEPGSTTAIVGPSGSGKSTLLSLIMGTRRPQGGDVLLDDLSVREWPLHLYRAQFAHVMQDCFLFSGTILENIRLGRPSASRNEVMEAARAAHCEAFISVLENGFDSVVGERGVRLSGGQRQRIAIARALLADRPVLVLDEATAHLDDLSETLVMRGLRRLRAGGTAIIIAHRLATVMNADSVILMTEGRIVAQGSHAELMQCDDRYQGFWARQSVLAPDGARRPVDVVDAWVEA